MGRVLLLGGVHDPHVGVQALRLVRGRVQTPRLGRNGGLVPRLGRDGVHAPRLERSGVQAPRFEGVLASQLMVDDMSNRLLISRQ